MTDARREEEYCIAPVFQMEVGTYLTSNLSIQNHDLLASLVHHPVALVVESSTHLASKQALQIYQFSHLCSNESGFSI